MYNIEHIAYILWRLGPQEWRQKIIPMLNEVAGVQFLLGKICWIFFFSAALSGFIEITEAQVWNYLKT